MLKSLKAKIVLTMILLVSISMIASTAISIYEIRTTVTSQMKNDGVSIARVINREVGKYVLNDSKNLGPILKEIKEENNENIKYVTIMDTNSQIIASSDDSVVESEDVEGSTDATSSASVEEEEETYEDTAESGQEVESSGYIFETDNGEKVYNVSTPIYEGDSLVGTIGVGISLNVMNSMISKSLMQLIITGIVILFIAIIVGVIIAKNITKPITNVIDKLDDFSKGDFTVEFTSNKKDETKKLTDALNKSIGMLKEMLIETKQDVNKLKDISSYLKTSGESVAISSQTVSASIEEVSQGTVDQSNNINHITEVLGEFNKKLKSVQEKVVDTTKSSTAIENNADIGSEKLQNLIKSIEDVRDSFKNTALRIENLNGDANQIIEIMNVINDVAEQTNLLALNAAIEAARAGEAGRGFSVVASEIRKLAEKVMDSSGSSNEIITNILSGVKEVNNTTEDITLKMDNQVSMVDNTMLAFKDIESEVHKTTPQFKDISKSLKDIMDEEDLILNSVEEASAISEEIAASTEEITASVQENTSTVEQLSEVADKIDEMTIRLNENIDRFKL